MRVCVAETTWPTDVVLWVVSTQLRFFGSCVSVCMCSHTHICACGCSLVSARSAVQHSHNAEIGRDCAYRAKKPTAVWRTPPVTLYFHTADQFLSSAHRRLIYTKYEMHRESRELWPCSLDVPHCVRSSRRRVYRSSRLSSSSFGSAVAARTDATFTEKSYALGAAFNAGR